MSTSIADLLLTLRDRVRSTVGESSPDLTVPDFYFEETSYKQCPYDMPIVVLRTAPCAWFQSRGGCTTCGYNSLAVMSDPVTDDNFRAKLAWVIRTLPPKVYPLLTITSIGSLMDPREVPHETLLYLLRQLDKAGYEHLNFESRPEYLLNVQRVRQIRQAFSGGISISIGFETCDDFIRQYCVHKGAASGTFLRAFRNLDAEGISFATYVLYGKPFLSEGEDIDDCVKTIEYATSTGADRILLMIANRQPGTLTDWLASKGKYKLPNLRGPFQILESLSEGARARVTVHGFAKSLPMAQEFARSCPRCTACLADTLRQWNYTGKPQLLYRATELACCRDSFLTSLDRARPRHVLEEEIMREWKQSLSFSDRNGGPGS